MFNVLDRNARRQGRHSRIRKRIVGSAERPRMSVHRSLKHVRIQLVDDIEQRTLASFSTLDPSFRKVHTKGGSVEGAKKLGQLAAGAFTARGIKRVVFDRGGYLYHGRIRALAESLREAGLEF